MKRVAVVSLVAILAAGCGGRRAAPHGPPGGPVPADFNPVSVTATSPDDAWVLGQATCGGSVCSAIVRTTDGGRHWAGLPPAPIADTSEAPNSIDALRFATPLVGYAFGAQPFRGSASRTPIWQTTDGGGHWRRLALANVRAFATSAGDVDVVTGACRNGVCGRLTFRRAPLGTVTWRSTVLPVTAAEPLVALTAHGSSIWISVSPTATHAQQTLLTSRDGGATFAAGRSPCVNGLGGDLEATSSSVVWAVCPTGMLAGALRSTDGGAGWTPIGGHRPLVNAAQLAPASDLVAVLATGDQAQLLRTGNGGRTFDPVWPVAAGSWRGVVFADASSGYALQIVPKPARLPLGPPYGELLRTMDGGATWSRLTIR